MQGVNSLDTTSAINSILKLYESKQLKSLIPLLPCLSIRGKPYGLNRHFTMEPFFKTEVPPETVWKCGRQVAKSVSTASSSIIQSVSIAYLNTLTIHPRFTQTRQFSNNVVRPLLEGSPIKQLMMDSKCENSVQQRSFKNNSNMYFSFAFLDAERCRGISADRVNYDEVQDLDASFIPVIQETMAASEHYGISQYTGTPKSFDNLIEGLWTKSSQAVWVTKCLRCNHYNHACLAGDILKMIGKKTVVCAKCDRPINPATGHYEHTFPDKVGLFEGYHVPQIILPMHYANPQKWSFILYKQENYSKTKYLNECLGESCDAGHKLVTLTELKAASTLAHKNELNQAVAMRGRYVDVAVGVDWSGSGATGLSTTAIVVMGKIAGSPVLHCIYLERLPNHMSDDDQSARVKTISILFKCSIIAHDFGGSGRVRETLLIHSKVPISSIIPMAYVRMQVGKILVHKPVDEVNPRSYYSVDKARSLTLICAYIKKMKILFPKYESCTNLLSDFMALVAESTENKHGSDNYVIGKAAGAMDDIAHAINFACLALWYRYKDFPVLEEIEGLNRDLDPEEVLPPKVW